MARLLATPGNGNIPYHGRRAQFMNGVGWGEEILSLFLVYWKFKLFCELGLVLGVLCLRSPLGDWLCNWSLSGEEKIVYCLVCKFIIITSISISFVVLLNSLYLNP